MYIADLSSYIYFHFIKKTMKHLTKLTLTSTTPEHIGSKNRPRRDYIFKYLCVLLTDGIQSSGVDAKVKRGVKQELALPSKQNLLVSCQDCQKALMTV